MAKTKRKATIAASNVPSQVEVGSGNDMIAEPALSESVEIEEAAMTTVLNKSEEVGNKEETNNGPDASEEVDETEESEDGIDDPEKVGDVEESEDGGLGKSEHGDKIEEPADALDKSEGDKEEETKEDGKEESLATDIPEGEEVEERDVNGDKEEETKEDGKEESLATDVSEGEKVVERDVTGEAKDNGKGENAPNKRTKRMRMRKKKPAAAAAAAANKSSDTDKQWTSAAEKDSKMAEDTKNDGKEESLATDVPEGEEVEERDATGEAKENGKGENALNKKAKRIRRRKKKAAAAAANDASKSSDADKKETLAAEKDSKMADGMGLIFMCNAKTKNDCFRYKVFGLPASKKEMVAKVYKGMRLFLFDIDLKLMYGIYRAADSGGYNIEPKAFKSAFPSQVRFTLLKDCLPLPEEKFKAAIKGNYYGKKKFNCELSPEQVKNLCKLFQSLGKTSRKKSSGEVIRAEPEQASSSRVRKTSHSERVRLDDSISRDQKRPRHERVRRDDSIPRAWKRSRRESVGRDDSILRNQERAHRERVRRDDDISRNHKRARHERVRRDDSIPRGQDLYATREAYASPPRLLALPPPPLPPVPYGYVRPADGYYYHEPLEYRDPYGVYREPVSLEVMSREALYREPASRETLYREAVFREPIPNREAVYPASLTHAFAPPTTYYRY